LSLIVLTILVAFFVGEPWFCKLCPAGTLEAGIPLVLWNPSGDIFVQGGPIVSRVGLLFYVKLLILSTLALAAIFIHQPFCRYACPLGAIYSLFNKVSFFRMRLYAHKCGFFHEYQDICPMEVNAQQNPNDKDCIRCLECTKCKSLAFKPFWRR
jgi:polyferredoxin